jgi:16S rRNA (guanine527-N7)-methyltransferase
LSEEAKETGSELLRQHLSNNAGLFVDREQAALLYTHLLLVLEKNKSMNLTRIESLADGFILHIEDSLKGLPEVADAPAGILGDMGSGAGFPGIPLALIGGRFTVLMEATHKKAEALRAFIAAIHKAEDIIVKAQRVEEITQEDKGTYAALTARALSSLPSLMELASPLLKKDGCLIAYKADSSEEELARAQRLEKTVGLELKDRRQIALSNGNKRSIITFVKTSEASISLPRRTGKAQKTPLA